MVLLLMVACTGSDTGAGDSAADTADRPCAYLPPGERLVLDEGCADGLCGGTVYPDAVALLGEPDTCGDVGRFASCAWGDLSATFPDCDDDGLPDTEYLCDQFDQTITVTGAWDGTTAEGLGLAVTVACWEAALGPQAGAGGWNFAFNPRIHVGVVGDPVTSVGLDWTFDE
ncbi:MAG: hypothetical protein Q8P41_27260 [Pseudomonadota bacterium]|nr:hypothetical protein [Pseudomonadota bacterium]